MQNQKKVQVKRNKNKSKSNNNNGKQSTPAKSKRRQRRKNRKGVQQMSSSNRVRTNFPVGLGSGGFASSRKQQIISEDETIGTIASPNSTAFSVLGSYPINPGQATTFPWLSKIAPNYEKYQFLSLEFYVVPQVSQFNTGGSQGEVVLSCDYDASDAPPTTYQGATDIEPHSTDMPYMRQRLRLSPKEMHKNSDAKFVRPGGLPGSSDIKTYDAGNFSISGSNLNASNFTVCSLHVRYVCKFTVPVLEQQNNAPANNSVSFFQSTATEAGLVTATPYTMLLATKTVNGLAAVNTAGSIVLPAGNYLIDFGVQFDNTSGEISSTLAYISYNSVQTPLTANMPARNDVGANTYLNSLVGCVYLSVNGTLPFTFVVESSFSGGSTTAGGYVRMTAI